MREGCYAYKQLNMDRRGVLVPKGKLCFIGPLMGASESHDESNSKNKLKNPLIHQ